MKTLYIANVSFFVANEVTVTICVGQSPSFKDAQKECELHNHHDLVIHVAQYYRALKMDHTVAAFIIPFEVEE